MKEIYMQDNNGHSSPGLINFPDICPLCNHAIDPKYVTAFCDNKKQTWDANYLQVVFRCTKINCSNLFISYYSKMGSTNFAFETSKPVQNKNKDFSQEIKEISGSFCDIYNESQEAESNSLDQIAGGGYRKSLEFLIKDYIIKKNPEKEEEVKQKFLSNCIKEDIEDANVKFMAEKATWLGNDQLHYVRQWENKDINDLKKLIDAVIHYISLEYLKKSFDSNE